MKVAVIGSNGQLGTDVCSRLQADGCHVIRLTHADIEVSDLDFVSRVLKELRPEAVVNTAAMHHVEKCEANPTAAFAVNGLGARNLALLCVQLDALLIHISTDYVFDGAKRSPYLESDPPAPLNVYGNTKLSGEYFVRTMARRHFVLRTSAIYGKSPCRAKGGLNFVELMLKLAREREEVRVVDSEVVSPTPTSQIAEQVRRLLQFDGYGLYHATAEGSCSWYEFALQIFRLTNTRTRLVVADPGEFPAKVPRPTYSVLENGGLKAHNLSCFRHWEEGLREYLGVGKLAGSAQSGVPA